MNTPVRSKTARGNFFEDFAVGQQLVHATPRTIGEGERALYVALTGSRFAVASADSFAQALGLNSSPLDDLLAFHIVFGKTVPDISLNAVANLGYAECRFGARVYPGDTLSTRSTVIGLKENSNRQTGTVYVRSTGVNQRGETVLDYVRWVMVRKGDPAAATPDALVPRLTPMVPAGQLTMPDGIDFKGWDTALAGSSDLWDDYAVGERIDHIDGFTIEEAEHMTATRLYQNTARVHFNQFLEKDGRFGKRIVYGGHVISLARAISFNGLANACFIAAINAGRHAAPCFAGDTVFAWSEVLDKAPIAGRGDVGALRIRTIATKDRPCGEFPGEGESVVLDLDYWVLIPRR